MKRTLKYGVLVLMLLIFLPLNVFAYYSEEEAKEILDKVSSQYDEELYEESGEKFYIINLPSISPNKITGEEKTCEYTKESIIDSCSDPDDCYGWATEEDWNDIILDFKNLCEWEIKDVIIKSYFKKLGITGYNEFLTEINGNTLVLGIPTGYSEEEGNLYSSRMYDLKFVESFKEDDRKKALELLDSFKDDYTIYGLRVLNAVYHYGGIDEAIYNNDLVLYRFPEVKELMEKNKEFEFSVTLGGAGGSPFINGNNGNIVVLKDGVIIATKNVNFTMNHTIFVDKDAKGTVFEKAENRISEYFGGSLKVKVETGEEYVTVYEDEVDDDWFTREMKYYFGFEEKGLKGYLTKVSIDGKKQDVLIVEVDKKFLDKVDIYAKDYETDITINTDSYEVPVDVTIESEDVSKEDYVTNASKDSKLTFKHVYDINLIGKGNGKHIKTIDAGVEVCIPISGYNIGDKVSVYYISENGKVNEEYEAEVVKIDGKLYAKFTTKHFSTYAVGDKKETEKVVDTGDNVIGYLCISILSILGMLVTKKLSKKA